MTTGRRPIPQTQTFPMAKEATYLLGKRYALGDGVEQDDQMAVELYENAAIQGHSQAQCALAVCLTHGTGVKQDLDRAHRLFHISAASAVILSPGIFSEKRRSAPAILDFSEGGSGRQENAKLISSASLPSSPVNRRSSYDEQILLAKNKYAMYAGNATPELHPTVSPPLENNGNPSIAPTQPTSPVSISAVSSSSSLMLTAKEKPGLFPAATPPARPIPLEPRIVGVGCCVVS